MNQRNNSVNFTHQKPLYSVDQQDSFQDVYYSNLMGKWELLSQELEQQENNIRLMKKDIQELESSISSNTQNIQTPSTIQHSLGKINQMLRQRAQFQQEMDQLIVVPTQIAKLRKPELKEKILQVCDIYQSERTQNDNMENKMKDMVNFMIQHENDPQMRENYQENLRSLQIRQQSIINDKNRQQEFKSRVLRNYSEIANWEYAYDYTKQENSSQQQLYQKQQIYKSEIFASRQKIQDKLFGGNSQIDILKEEIERLRQTKQLFKDQIQARASQVSTVGYQECSWVMQKNQFATRISLADARQKPMDIILPNHENFKDQFHQKHRFNRNQESSEILYLPQEKRQQYIISIILTYQVNYFQINVLVEGSKIEYNFIRYNRSSPALQLREQIKIRNRKQQKLYCFLSLIGKIFNSDHV